MRLSQTSLAMGSAAEKIDSEHESSDYSVSNRSSSEPEETEKVKTPPKKITKRLCRFKPSWEAEFDWCWKVSANSFVA